jgi:hypothetical protein
MNFLYLETMQDEMLGQPQMPLLLSIFFQENGKPKKQVIYEIYDFVLM